MLATFKSALVHFSPNEFDEGVFPRMVRSSPRAVVSESPELPHAGLRIDAIHIVLLSFSQMLNKLELSSSKLRPMPNGTTECALSRVLKPSMRSARKVLWIGPRANEQAPMNKLKMAERG